jgi:hypothetical protein
VPGYFFPQISFSTDESSRPLITKIYKFFTSLFARNASSRIN